MHTKVILFATIVAGVALSTALPVGDNENGKYQNSVDNKSDGKYRPSSDGKYRPSSRGEGATDGYYDAQGHYIHSSQPYRHVHDNRELGKYMHIPYPYDGGYGPYNGSNIPYMHVDVPYDHNLYTSTTTTTKKPTTTTTTTTTTPRTVLFNYDEEGKYKVVHQEDARKHDKYDHSYLTENGIYGEEQAKLHKNGGTDAKGFYEYTGDDGKLYRVHYESNHNGFVPRGDHIPTPPPIPEAIARALKYVDDLRKSRGEMPMFDQRGFRIDPMSSKDIMAKIKSIHLEEMPKEISDQIIELQHEVEEYQKMIQQYEQEQPREQYVEEYQQPEQPQQQQQQYYEQQQQQYQEYQKEYYNEPATESNAQEYN